MRCFNLCKDSKIWIYGCGKVGRETFDNLSKCGYAAQGFIDKRAETIRAENNIKCLTPEEFSKDFPDNDCIIFVGLWNGRQQEITAKILFEAGFDKLIYLPMASGSTLEEFHIMRQAYRNFLMGNFDDIRGIPCYNCSENIYSNEDLVISMSSHSVCFWYPVCKLHSSRMEDFYKITDIKAGSSPSLENISMKYADIPLDEMIPYKNLFLRLNGDKNADLHDYFLLTKGNTEFDKQKFLNDRAELYKIFEYAYEYDLSFFADSAANCQWNENGYFNVIDGLHRIFFLVSKGKNKVPICVDVSDWKKYKDWKGGCD